MMKFYYKNTKIGVRVFGENGVDYTFNAKDTPWTGPLMFRIDTNKIGNNKWSNLSQEEFDNLVSMLLDNKAIKRFLKFGRA